MELTEEQREGIRECCKDQACFEKVLQILHASTDKSVQKAKKYSVLAVDDNEHIAHLVEVALEPVHCAVTCVLNGRDALAEINRKKWDLVFLDIMLPDIDGGEILLRIREHEVNKETPVVFITGLIKPEEEAGLVPRNEKYLGKPFTADRLRSVAREILVG